ncbi:MAG: hypothetical protein IJN16_06550 [Lachnospiraceae bacterium]|nr:hypothetical protein [Lachnospiraceae bacterium]
MKRCGLLSKGVAKVMAVVMAVSMMFNAELPVDAAGSTVIFKGGDTNESYESNDASWLLNAADSDVITVKYTCTDDTHAGWGVLGWGATVDGNWKDGPGLSASESDATEKMSAKVTVKDFKKILGIKASSDVSFIKLGAWNGGKIESISISAKSSAAATTDKAAATETKEEETKEVVIEAPPELSGDYLYLLDSTKTITIWPDLYCQYWVPGQTIIVTVEMESNGSFGGCLGTCVNKWAWAMESFSSDTGSTIEVKWMLTPIQNNIQLQFWWMSGSQIGIKSIKVDRATDPNPLSKLEQVVTPSEPARDPYEGNANAAYSGYVDFADGGWWTEKEISVSELISNVDPSTITSIVFNGETDFTVGYKPTGSDWAQPTGATSYTITDVNFADYMLKLCLSKGNDVVYRFTWDVYTNGATPAVGGGSAEEETPSNVKTATYTFDDAENGNNETFSVDLYTYFPDLQEGDQVKLTADFITSGGWYGGGLGANDSSVAGGWTQTDYDSGAGSSVSQTVTVYGGSNSAQVQMWWIGGADVDCTLTMEKL